MKFINCVIIFITLAIAIDSINCQFYVDIEHSLPRIGKRGEDTFSLKDIFSNRKLNKHQDIRKDSTEDLEKKLLYSASNTLQLIRILLSNGQYKD